MSEPQQCEYVSPIDGRRCVFLRHDGLLDDGAHMIPSGEEKLPVRPKYRVIETYRGELCPEEK